MKVFDLFHGAEEKASVNEFIKDDTETENNWLLGWDGASKDFRWEIKSIVSCVFVGDMCTKFDSKFIKVFDIEVLKEDVGRWVAVVDLVISLSFDCFDDFDHHIGHVDVSFFFIWVFHLHEFFESHLGFVHGGSFFLLLTVSWGRAAHLLDSLLALDALGTDESSFFWFKDGSFGTSGVGSFGSKINSWFVSWLVGGRFHFVWGFNFFSCDIKFNF